MGGKNDDNYMPQAALTDSGDELLEEMLTLRAKYPSDRLRNRGNSREVRELGE